MSKHCKHRVYVTGGDNMVSFSGCSYFFMKSLKEEMPGSEVEALPMCTYRALAGAALKWGALMGLDPRPYFFMTREYQDANWGRFASYAQDDAVLVSFPQILPSRTKAKLRKRLLIVDMTHQQYLGYPQFSGIPDRVRRAIFDQEQDSYDQADRIFAVTATVRRQLIANYAVPDKKIEVIGRGLNLPGAGPKRNLSVKSEPLGNRPIRIGFVGLDFRRKGLLQLIEAIDSHETFRRRFVIDAVGPGPGDLADRPYLHLFGYIDKDTDLKSYIEIISRCDVGYLFSRSEGIPGSVLEFLSFGIPCMISDIEGMESIRDLPGVLSLPLQGGAASVANALRALLERPEHLENLKAAASKLRFNGWRDQARAVARWCGA